MPELNSIGLLELSSVAVGYLAEDAMLKAAPVELLQARTICSGKYIVMVRGRTRAFLAGPPLLKRPTWIWSIPVYFFVGGAAGGGAVIATIARWSGERRLARDARALAVIGAFASPPLLIVDLGRPTRFLHMLRVFKWRSPMSVGVWTLVLFSMTNGGALAAEYLSDHADDYGGALRLLASIERESFSGNTLPVMLAALGKENELAMHLRATPNTGVTPAEVKELLLQVAVYAGIPAANSAMAIAKKVYAELAENKSEKGNSP